MSFLPEDYVEPTGESNYLNLSAEGDYTIRILSAPIMGYEYWKTIDKKRTPIRKRLTEKIDTNELEVNSRGELEIPKFFWAMKVYNWDKDRVQVWEVKQSKIRKPIETLSKNKKWGDPANYDIVVTRTGLGFNDTDYQVVANPPIEPLDKDLQAKCDTVVVNLEALFDGADPFTQQDTENAPQEVVESKKTEINIEDIDI